MYLESFAIFNIFQQSRLFIMNNSQKLIIINTKLPVIFLINY